MYFFANKTDRSNWAAAKSRPPPAEQNRAISTYTQRKRIENFLLQAEICQKSQMNFCLTLNREGTCVQIRRVTLIWDLGNRSKCAGIMIK